MATFTITVSDGLADWIDRRVRDGGYRDPSDFVGDLVARDSSRGRDVELTIEDVRRIVEEAEASGVSDLTLDEIFQEALRQARAEGLRVG